MAGQWSARKWSTSSTATTLRLKELPHLAFGRGAEKTIRHFPDKLPIGIAGDGRTHVFLYLVNRPTPVDFRAFLHRHAELLRALPEWELRLLVPRHLVKAVAALRGCGSRGVEPALAVWTMPPSFAGISGNRTKSIDGGAPETISSASARLSHFQSASVSRALSALEEERRPARECHSLPGARGQDRATQRPRDQRGAASCLCPSLTPGWLGVVRRSPRTEGGPQTREERSPSWCLSEVAVSARRPHVGESERVSRMLLRASELRDAEIRAAFCAARGCATSVRDDSEESSRGVNDPLCHPPNPVPGPVGRGSLTPRLRVSFVRTK